MGLKAEEIHGQLDLTIPPGAKLQLAQTLTVAAFRREPLKEDIHVQSRWNPIKDRTRCAYELPVTILACRGDLGDSPDFPVADTFLQEVGKVVGKLHVTGAQ
jgi:hypothetical protein